MTSNHRKHKVSHLKLSSTLPFSVDDYNFFLVSNFYFLNSHHCFTNIDKKKKDLKNLSEYRLTREQFEDICADIWTRILEPINDAL